MRTTGHSGSGQVRGCANRADRSDRSAQSPVPSREHSIFAWSASNAQQSVKILKSTRTRLEVGPQWLRSQSPGLSARPAATGGHAVSESRCLRVCAHFGRGLVFRPDSLPSVSLSQHAGALRARIIRREPRAGTKPRFRQMGACRAARAGPGTVRA